MDPIIQVRNLTKSYGDVRAVQGIDLDVRSGEIFAMLGPNGAGKSTTVEILEGLRPRDGGDVSVLGIDPSRDATGLKSRIGVVLQQSVFPNKIRVIEVIELYGRLYRANPNAKELLERFALTEKANTFYAELSGGQKQKLALILAMINDPPIVFLDEPTTGVDAHSRRAIHDWLRQLRAEGRTVFLTTHYIHEAEQLADRVAIVARGKVIAEGTLDEIRAGVNVGDHRPPLQLKPEIRVRTANPLSLENLRTLPGVASVREAQAPQRAALTDERPEHTALQVDSVGTAMTHLVRYLDSQNNELLDVAVWHPTLEDVFLQVTGERMTGEEES